MSLIELLLDLLAFPAVVIGTVLGIAAALLLGWLGPEGTNLLMAQACLVALGFAGGMAYALVTWKRTRGPT